MTTQGTDIPGWLRSSSIFACTLLLHRIARQSAWLKMVRILSEGRSLSSGTTMARMAIRAKQEQIQS